MSQHYGNYLRETFKKSVLEKPFGFAIYSIEKGICYIEDIYIEPSKRNQGLGQSLEREIIELGKAQGCEKLLASVVIGNPGDSENMARYLHTGYRLANCGGNNVVFLTKEI